MSVEEQAELIDKAKQGARLYFSQGGSVAPFGSRDDVFQSALLIALSNAVEGDNLIKTKPSVLPFRVASRLHDAARKWRTGNRNMRLADPEVLMESVTDRQAVSHEVDAPDLSGFTKFQRRIIKLRAAGKSYQQIAKTVGKSYNSIKSAFYRIRVKARRDLLSE